METSPDLQPPEQPQENDRPQENVSAGGRPRQRFWHRFGGDGFLISLGLHVIVGIIGAYLIVSKYIEPEKEVEDFTTGGGGSGGANAKMFEQRIKPKNPRNLVKSQNKLAVKGGKASVALPDMPQMQMSALESGALSGGASKGFGGGSGGGDGIGIGLGKGGGKNMVSAFGMLGRGGLPNMLEGTMYDTKRNRDGKELFDFGNAGERVGEMEKAIKGFARNGGKKEYLDSKYATAPDKVSNSKVFIPQVPATSAMQYFGAEKEIKAPGWLLYYEAWITPPATDEYRLCGMGDDAMLVLIDGKSVLWAPWSQGTMGAWIKSTREWQPEAAYKAGGSLPNLGNGGRYFGSWVKMEKGKTYKLQMILGDSYGGGASAEVMVQQKSINNEKFPDIKTPFPIFKLAPLTDEDLDMLKKHPSKMAWTPDGPNFGCEINNVKPPRQAGTIRR